MRFASVLCSALLAGTPLLSQTRDIGAPPGRLVDIDGRNLHVYCTGKGSPSVILEAGAGAFAIDWSLVQPEVARTNRVCSYDRAGSGWSDPSKVVETAATVVQDLHAGLRAAGVTPPYVIVGASVGGIYVRMYSIRYPSEVTAMVLVDPSYEERLFTMFEGKPVTIASLTADQVGSTIPPGPAIIPSRLPQTGAPFDLLPPDLYELRVKLEMRLIASIPRSVPHDVVVASAEGERAALARLHEINTVQEYPLGDRPLVVLTRGLGSSQGLKDAHAALARQSTNSRHTVVTGAGHEIHLFKPAAVVQAIQDVLEAASNGKRLTDR
jgi:pimeloyl-ACP methyl ester carboxylesterase